MRQMEHPKLCDRKFQVVGEVAKKNTGGIDGPDKIIDYRDAMINLYNSPEYQELSAYYAKKSAFSVLGIARRETRHSNMIAWLLTPKSGHDFGKNPMRRFLLLLAIAKKRYAVNRNSILPERLQDLFITGNFDIGEVKVEKEVSIANDGRRQDEDGRIDLVLTVRLVFGDERKELPVIIENKVGSDEHKVRGFNEYQTLVYRNWAMEKFADKKKYLQPLLVFLTPDGSYELETGNGEIKPCRCDQYLRINYQGLVDNVIAPCLKANMPDDIRHFLNDYLRCLSFETLNTDERKTSMIMALAPQEKALLHAFWEKNEDLLLAAMYALSEDASIDLDDEVRAKMKETAEGVQKRDKTKFKIGENGVPLFQGRMVLEVVKRYVQEHEGVSFQELRQAFPDALSLPNKYGVVKILTEQIQNQPRKRYFVNDTITLADGTVVVVSSQWGRDKGDGNIPGFVERAKALGYDVREV